MFLKLACVIHFLRIILITRKTQRASDLATLLFKSPCFLNVTVEKFIIAITYRECKYRSRVRVPVTSSRDNGIINLPLLRRDNDTIAIKPLS